MSQTPLRLAVIMVVATSLRSSLLFGEPSPMLTHDDGNRKAGVGLELRLSQDFPLAMAWCPPGKFMMGRNEQMGAFPKNNIPRHEVRLARGFWIATTEVTQAQWKATMNTEPWVRVGDEAYYRTGPKYPAQYVSWEDANQFCAALTVRMRERDEIPRGYEFRLPTEAQWEYACRAGTSTTFSFGDDPKELSNYGWFNENTVFINESYPHEVALKKPNAWGLYDMHGNVSEWCFDSFDPDAYSARKGRSDDPVVDNESRDRVLRGGEWVADHRRAHAAGRSGFPASENDFFILGFRVALIKP